MRRLPNPWVAVPVLLSGLTGGAVGYIVTDASCGPGSCTVAAVIAAIVTGLAIAAGVGVVAVLALRSLDEHRVHRDRMILVVDPEEDHETDGAVG
ncbi:MAG: hypothetical protein Q8Q29_11425 [Actinomycetota bacterium]|nr:hypothetical protein [Actinomycetota bacterium]